MQRNETSTFMATVSTAVVLVVLMVFTIHAHSAGLQEALGPLETDGEADLQDGRAIANSENSYRLFTGTNTTTLAAQRIEISSGAAIPAFAGTEAWGAAYDPVQDIVYFSDREMLYAWSPGSPPSLLGDVVNQEEEPFLLHGLAYYDGTLYGSSVSVDQIATIDITTLVATPHITLVDTGSSISGLAADPTSGELYGTDDGTNQALVRINLNGTLTPVASYLNDETDVDGLAITLHRKAILITDDPSPPYFNVFDLEQDSYTQTIPYPWDQESAAQVSGAWIDHPPPQIGVHPLAISNAQQVGAVITRSLTISNSGESVLQWHFYGQAPEAIAHAGARPIPKRVAQEERVVRSTTDCPQFERYAGSEPPGFAAFCATAPSRSILQSVSAATDMAFALDIGPVSDNFVTHVLNDFPGQAILGANERSIYAMDFDPSATTLYAIDNLTRELGRLNLDNGAFTPLVAISGVPDTSNISGLAIDPTTGEAYISSVRVGPWMTLYKLDLATGAATPLGGDPAVSLVIDISIGPQGVIYGHDIDTDAIYTFSKHDGTATLVGPTGVRANFAQAIDFDNDDGTLYAYIYQGGSVNQYGTIDLQSGAFSALSADDPPGEFEGATQTVTACDPLQSIAWLSAGIDGGDVGAQASETIAMTFDAAGQPPGEYTVTLCLISDDPLQGVVQIPLSLAVEEPQIYLPLTRSD